MIGPLLALAAAVALNGSYLLQHAGSVHAVAISPLRPVRTFSSLLRSPLWTLGAVAGLSGWALHVAALRQAPLSLVQAFVAGGLALTVPLGALALHQRLSAEERQALGLMVAALLALALGLPPEHAGHTFSPAALAAWTAALGATAAALAVRGTRRRGERARGDRAVRGARRRGESGRGDRPTAAPNATDVGGTRRRAAGRFGARSLSPRGLAAAGPAALGVAGGLLYGAADLAIKALTTLPEPFSLRGAPWLAVAALATAGAFFAFQRGLQGPRPLPVIALMTTATNVSSIAGAFVVFGDPLGRTPQLAVLHAFAFALVAASAWRLAPAQARLSAA